MKKLNLIIGLSLIAAIAVIPGCKSKQEVSKSEGGFKEIDIPCSGPKYRSDKNFFRADNSATSQDMSLSREKALTLAKQRLASLIETQIKSVTDRYVNEREFGDDFDSSLMEGLVSSPARSSSRLSTTSASGSRFDHSEPGP